MISSTSKPRLPKFLQHPLALGLATVYCLVLLNSCGTRPIEVEDLIRNASKYNGQIVTVKGCHYIGFELEIISSCNHADTSSNWEDTAIWIERYSLIEAQEKWIGPRNDIRRPERKRTQKEIMMESQLTVGPDLMVASCKAVTLRGEFKASPSPIWGNEGKYRYQFILHQALSVSAPPHKT
jgi:hypothetical protein